MHTTVHSKTLTTFSFAHATAFALALLMIWTCLLTSPAWAQSLPSAPSNFRVIGAGPGSVDLAWDPIEGLSGYDIYVDGKWHTWVSGASTSSTTLVGLAENAVLDIAIESTKNNTLRSEPDSHLHAVAGDIAPPTGLSVSNVSNGAVTLSWIAPSDARIQGDGNASFDVWSVVDGGVEWIAWQSGGNTTRLDITGLESGKAYELFVTAKSAAYVDGARTPHEISDGPPVAQTIDVVPGGFTCRLTNNDDGTVSVTWPDIGANGYDVSSVDAETVWVTETHYTDSSATGGYTVTAWGNGTDGEQALCGVGMGRSCKRLHDGQRLHSANERFCVEFPHGFVDLDPDGNELINDRKVFEVNGANDRDIVHVNAARQITGHQTYAWPGASEFGVVRMALDWPVMEPEKGVFNEDAWLALDQAVANARENGLKVILDPIHIRHPSSKVWLAHTPVHNIPAWAWPRTVPAGSTSQALYSSGWSRDEFSTYAHAYPYLQKVVSRYKDNPSVIAFDLINEPSHWDAVRDAASFQRANSDLLQLQLDWILQLRTIDPYTPMIIEPTRGNAKPECMADILSQLRPATAPAELLNVMLTQHDYYDGYGNTGRAYPGYGGCYSGGEFGNTYGYDGGLRSRISREQSILDMINNDWLAVYGQYDVPFIVSEYGYYVTTENVVDAATYKFCAYAELNDLGVSIPRTVWRMFDGSGYGLLNYNAGWNKQDGIAIGLLWLGWREGKPINCRRL